MKLFHKIVNPFSHTADNLKLEQKWRHRLIKIIYLLLLLGFSIIVIVGANQQWIWLVQYDMEIDYKQFRLYNEPTYFSTNTTENVPQQPQEKSKLLSIDDIRPLLDKAPNNDIRSEILVGLVKKWYTIKWYNDPQSQITQAPQRVDPQFPLGNKIRESSTLWKIINQAVITGAYIINNILALVSIAIIHQLMLLFYYKGVLYVVFWNKKDLL